MSQVPELIYQRPRWVKVAFWVALGLALVLAALPTLLYPLTRDQGIYAYIADLMLHGGAPFRDAWELKPPAAYFTYSLAFLLFGRSELSVRIFDVLYTLLGAAAVGALAWEAYRDRRIAALSAWLYAFSYYFSVHFHAMATPEAFMSPWLVASVYGMLYAVRNKSLRALIAGGACAGVVFWFKPTAGLPVVAMLVWACTQMRREHWPRSQVWRGLIAFVAGGVVGLLPIGLYLYNHGLRELLEIWSAYGTGAYLEAGGLVRGDSLFAALDVMLRYVRDWQLVAWLTLAGAVSALAWRRRNRNGEALVVFLLSSLLATLVQAKLFEYHWIPILAPAAVLAAMCLVWLAQEMRDRPSVLLCDMRNIFVLTVVLGLALWLGYEHLGRYRSTIAFLTGRRSAEQYYAQFDLGYDFSAIGTRQAAAYLRNHTTPEQTVLIWGVEPLVNFLAGRRSPTSFISFYVLVDGKDRNPRWEAWRQDFLQDLRSKPPAYIVLVERDVTPLAPVGSRARLEEFPAFKQILETQYQFEAQVEDYQFYRLKSLAAQPIGSMKKTSSLCPDPYIAFSCDSCIIG